jgi:serine/threonine protein kinase
MDDLFVAGLGLPLQKRMAFWVKECGGDREMLSELRKLQDGHDAAEEIDFLNKAAWSPKSTTASGNDEGWQKMNRGEKFGKFTIKECIGAGGMGEVYLARDEVLSRDVVIKLVKGELDPDSVARFRREMKTLAQIKHENVVLVYEGDIKDGHPYMVMEHLPGVDLRRFMENQGKQKPLPLRQVAEITRQACAGLAQAHQLGIVHRDIKPANIFILQNEKGLQAKVIDFGLAIPPVMTTTEAANDITHKPTVGAPGTFLYMSPEQLEGKRADEIDARSDIYSFGLVVYEMLTGRMAFPLAEHRYYKKPLDPPSKLNPELSKEIDDVVMRALAESPGARQQKIEELAQQLDAAIHKPSKKPAPDPAPAPKPWPISRKLIPVAAALLIALLFAPQVYRAINNGPPPSPTVEVSPPPTATPAPELNSLALSIYRNAGGKDYKPVSPDTIFHNQESIRISLKMPQDGYVYMVQQGSSGRVQVIFPHPRINAGNNRAVRDQELIFPPEQSAPPMKFDNRPGTETVYVLFARAKGEKLFEPVEKAILQGFPKNGGMLTLDPLTGSSLIEELKRRAQELAGSAEADNERKSVKGTGPLVAILSLRHEK